MLMVMDSLPWIIVRPAMIYGPGDSNGLGTPTFTRSLS